MFQRMKDNKAIAAAIHLAKTTNWSAEQIHAISTLRDLPLTTASIDFLESLARGDSGTAIQTMAVEILISHREPLGVEAGLAALADGCISEPTWSVLNNAAVAARMTEFIDRAMPALEWGEQQVLRHFRVKAYLSSATVDDFRWLLGKIDAPEARALEARFEAEVARIVAAREAAKRSKPQPAPAAENPAYEVLFGATSIQRLGNKPREQAELPLFSAADIASLAGLPERLSACTFTCVHELPDRVALTDEVAQRWGSALNAALASAIDGRLSTPPVLKPIAETRELVLYVAWREPVSRAQIIKVAEAVQRQLSEGVAAAREQAPDTTVASFQILFGPEWSAEEIEEAKKQIHAPVFRALDLAALDGLPHYVHPCVFLSNHTLPDRPRLRTPTLQRWSDLANAAFQGGLRGAPAPVNRFLDYDEHRGVMSLSIVWNEPVSRHQLKHLATIVQSYMRP